MDNDSKTHRTVTAMRAQFVPDPLARGSLTRPNRCLTPHVTVEFSYDRTAAT